MDRSAWRQTPSERPAPGEGAGAEPPEFAHGWLEGVRLFCEEDYDGARRRFQSLLLTSPDRPALLAACGHCHLHAGDGPRALEFYERAERVGAALPEVAYNIAILSLRTGQPSRVIERFRSLLDAPPAIQSGRFYLGLLFKSQEEFLCEVCLYLGQVHRELEDMRQARAWLEQALLHRPENVTALQRLAEVAIVSRSYIEAIGHLTRVTEISPLEEDRINAHNNLGIACYENGMLEDAIQHLTWVLKRSPANPSAIHNLSFIYEREGIFRDSGSPSLAIRFVDVEEGALPIFQLSASEQESPPGGPAIVGRSAEMLRVMRHARVAAAADAPVLIRGESGTGKELLGQLIALNSSRRADPFAVVNCSAVSEADLESELFGHEKGAFTGARARKLGALESARGGAVFLDEVADLTPRMQGRLLRAMREGGFVPMGGTSEVKLDVRVISATNRDLSSAVRAGTFREDLFYLLKVIPIEIPPLRERSEDVPLLVDFFLQKYARHEAGRRPRFPAEDLRALMEYDWPGNVRELENLVQRAAVMGSQSSLYLEEVARLRRARSTVPRRAKATGDAISYPLNLSLADLEMRHIKSVLESCGGNQRQAAKILGINPTTLWRKLKSRDEG